MQLNSPSVPIEPSRPGGWFEAAVGCMIGGSTGVFPGDARSQQRVSQRAESRGNLIGHLTKVPFAATVVGLKRRQVVNELQMLRGGARAPLVFLGPFHATHTPPYVEQ